MHACDLKINFHYIIIIRNILANSSHVVPTTFHNLLQQLSLALCLLHQVMDSVFLSVEEYMEIELPSPATLDTA